MTPNGHDSWRGIRQVLLYNWPTYAWTALGCVSGGVATAVLPVPPALKRLAGLGIGAAGAWSVSSLLASHYVYDRSELGRWDWAADLFAPESPRRVLNIHAGVDEAGGTLERVFAGAEIQTADMFDPLVTRSASIRRARARARAQGQHWEAEPVDPTALPFEDAAWDAVLLVFAAHEVRDTATRHQLFREIRRVLRPGGRLLVVEHLRDLPNFLVFGPGFVHFLPRRAWLRAAQEARLTLARERSVTPFVRVFVLEKTAA